MSVLLGLDQSTKTGYAVCDAATGEIITSGHYNVKSADGKRLSAGAAFNRFEHWLEALLEEHAPVLVVFEQPHFQGYSATVELSDSSRSYLKCAPVTTSQSTLCTPAR